MLQIAKYIKQKSAFLSGCAIIVASLSSTNAQAGGYESFMLASNYCQDTARAIVTDVTDAQQSEMFWSHYYNCMTQNGFRHKNEPVATAQIMHMLQTESTREHLLLEDY